MPEVKIKVIGIPVVAQFSIDPGDASVGIDDAIEDVVFYNVNNRSRLDWLSKKLTDKQWDKVNQDIWDAYESQPKDYR